MKARSSLTVSTGDGSSEGANNALERGVSPVIGVVLLVAIAVLSMAVVGAFVLESGPNQPPPDTNVVMDQNGDGDITLVLASSTPIPGDLEIRNESNELCHTWEGVIEQGDTIKEEDFDEDCESPDELRIIWVDSSGSQSVLIETYDLE